MSHKSPKSVHVNDLCQDNVMLEMIIPRIFQIQMLQEVKQGN